MLNESLQICRERQPTLLITTPVREQGSGLELITTEKQLLPDLRSLLLLKYEHHTLLEQAMKNP